MSEPTTTVKVSIVIPTFNRNEGLKQVVDSILALPDTNLSVAEIVIVDNSVDANARDTVQNLISRSAIPIKYISEPNPGVANARNAGLSVAKSHLIAFIDDDETAQAGWLDNLLDARDAFHPSVVFGPVQASLPDSVTPDHTAYLKAFFSRFGPDKTQRIEDSYGCGNALLDLEKIRPLLPEDTPVFNKIANETGGEDDFLFNQIKQQGGTFAWAHTAIVTEHVPAHRATLKYTLQRAFAYGQGPTTMCWRQSPKNIPGMVFWSLVGLGQFIVFGFIAAALFLIRSDKRANWIDKAVRGIGKVLWFPPFNFSFYGAASLKKKPANT